MRWACPAISSVRSALRASASNAIAGNTYHPRNCLTPQEQLKRFEKRQGDPLRRWKLTEEDWRNRDRIDLYNESVEDMFDKTDHQLAPWHLVSGEQKRWARVEIIETLIKRIEEGVDAFDNPVGVEDGWA